MNLSLKPLTLKDAYTFGLEWMPDCEYEHAGLALVVIAPGDKTELVVELLVAGDSKEMVTVTSLVRARAIALALLSTEA